MRSCIESVTVSCDHIDRLEFFANEFLINYEDQPLAEGYDEVGGYLGDWFIRKAMWSDEASMLANIGTFEKLYDYRLSIGHVDQDRYSELRDQITRSDPDWLRCLRRYNDPSIEFEDVWDLDGTDEAAADSGGEMAREGCHFVLMLSGNAAKHFKVTSGKLPKVDDLGGENHWFNCWRCDVLAAHAPSSTVYFILTNARTLYSLIIANSDRRIESMVSVLSQVLGRQVERCGSRGGVPDGGTFSLVKGQPRSLIGSQNELIRCAMDLFEKPDPSLEVMCDDLNGTMMMALEETFPDRAFKKMLAADPPKDSDGDDKIIPLLQSSPNLAPESE